jgi:hypothetical protein
MMTDGLTHTDCNNGRNHMRALAEEQGLWVDRVEGSPCKRDEGQKTVNE